MPQRGRLSAASRGLYPDAPKPSAVLGYEVAGEVDAVGEDAGYRPADRVVATTPFSGHAEMVCVPAQQGLPIPGGMSFESPILRLGLERWSEWSITARWRPRPRG